MKVKGFNPVFDKNSKILILGSFPSLISRHNQFYYGNPRNRFWNMINKIFNVELLTTNQKIEFLLKHNIAIWDIVCECEIEGSMDKDVKNPIYADLVSILPPQTKINKIICNGKLSYNLTMEYCKNNNIDIPIVYLQSTSPANPRFNISDWEKELKK